MITPHVATQASSAQPTAAHKPMALTMGDPAGIGPEIVVKALYQWHDSSSTPVWVAGSGAVIAQTVAQHCRCVQVQPKPVYVVSTPEEAHAQVLRTPHAVVVVEGVADSAPVANPVPPDSFAPPTPPTPWGNLSSPALGDLVVGQVSAAAGAAAAEAVRVGAQACLQGQACALVTAPIHKLALTAAGIAFPGHTEMLQAMAAQHLGVSVDDVPVRMLLANDELQTVLLSIHVSLRQALEQVTVGNVLQTLQLTQRWVPRASGDAPLRIAVAGVNPHAGEGGRFGREEIDVMMPAIAQARALGMDVSDPLSPDTVYMRARAGEFDVVVAAYHDQGLIPVKYLGVADGVNATLGLPFVRTSPDHGTAFDIAGQGQADASSLLYAMRWAEQAVARPVFSL
jgi:4-hydroxythreonine-4-phosphate dehydrogenase